ncbi:MAG: hypothetical protein KGZ30_03310 [Anaplasmataceae bacterium]|nr:hypothetical protein [Anaplasmataceae bacterium]
MESKSGQNNPQKRRTQVLVQLLIACACLSAFFLSGCRRYYVEVYQQRVDASYLASNAVNTPDPRSSHPPLGQLFVVEWQVPLELLPKNPFIEFDANFLDYSERRYVFAINQRKGFKTFFVVDHEFIETGGIFTYRAKIKTEDGEVFREWRHQLWVNLITIDNSEQQPPQSNVSSKPNPSKDL